MDRLEYVICIIKKQGEGGMLAGKCSIIGIGSDIGGSIRFPAGFNGVYGYKPCSMRVCTSGSVELHPAYEGGRNLVTSNGPMGSI